MYLDEIFHFATKSRPSLGLNQSSIERAPPVIPPGLTGRGVKPTILLNLEPRLGMRGAEPPLAIRLHDVVLN
jgi:hypothetical protein